MIESKRLKAIERVRKLLGKDAETTEKQPRTSALGSPKNSYYRNGPIKYTILRVCSNCHFVNRRTRYKHTCIKCNHPLDTLS